MADGDGGILDADLLPRCGDGTEDPDEACDDDNNVSGDGCSAVCRDETIYCDPGAVGTEYVIGNSAPS